MLQAKILGAAETVAYNAAQELVRKFGCKTVESLPLADVAIAPLLTEKLSEEEVNAPRFGTLVFHPSPLPHGRGASAIKWAYKRKEPIRRQLGFGRTKVWIQATFVNRKLSGSTMICDLVIFICNISFLRCFGRLNVA